MPVTIKVMQSQDYVVHIKYIENFLDKPNIIKRDIQDILMHTSEPYSTREDTQRVNKIQDSTYEMFDLKKFVSVATQLNPRI